MVTRPGAHTVATTPRVTVPDLAPLDLAAVDAVGVHRAALDAVRAHPVVVREAEACETLADRLAAGSERAGLARRTIAAWSRAHPTDDGQSLAAYARDHLGALPPRHEGVPF